MKPRCEGCGHVLPQWTSEQMIRAAQQWTVEHGRQPRTVDWLRSGPYWPAQSTAAKRFGSWGAYLRAAGLTPRNRWTDDEILDRLVAWRDQHGRWPSSTEWRGNRPADRTVVKRFGSWPRAIRQAERYWRSLRRRDAVVDVARLRLHLTEWMLVTGLTGTDVAAAAGVSPAAVHKVMNGRNGSQAAVTVDVADRLLVAIDRPDLLEVLAA